MIDGSLYRKLRNWGDWLNHEAEIVQPDARCISIECRYMPEAGDVFEDEQREPMIVPNVADAEFMQRLIAKLDSLPQYALAIRYGGAPSVMRWRRVGEHAQTKFADIAEIELLEMMRKSA